MRQVSDIAAERAQPRESVVRIALRTPEAAKAMTGTGDGLHVSLFVIGSAGLTLFAWQGGFGDTVHGFFMLTIAVAALFWVTHTGARIWQRHNAMTSADVTVMLTPQAMIVTDRDRPPVRVAIGDHELRFAARPHWLGKQEQRDEQRVQHPIGYEYRDAWEVWCEAGLDVVLIAAVSHEDDARAIVRQLTEELLFVTRDAQFDHDAYDRTEPA
ncbi:MAG: hypothetical protein AAFU66_06735 [Pseudomonadota bacterium]